MMNLSKIIVLTAALAAANMSFAQTSAVGAKATADIPAASVSATTGASVTAPSVMPAPVVSGTAAASVNAGTTMSNDPYVQKREADHAAKKDFKMRKKMAKAEYKEEKAEAKSDLKGEKRMSSRERKAALEADTQSGNTKPVGN